MFSCNHVGKQQYIFNKYKNKHLVQKYSTLRTKIEVIFMMTNGLLIFQDIRKKISVFNNGIQ